MLHIAHHSLVLALGLGTIRAAGLGHKAVMLGQEHKARVEAQSRGCVLDHRRPLVIYPHLTGEVAEIGECPHQTLAGMFGIAPGRGVHIETA